MAGRAALHEWINSVVAVVALIASCASTYLAWQGNQAKKEDLALVARLINTCQTEYHRIEKHGALGLCWLVTLANTSESRISIVDDKVFTMVGGKLVLVGPFRNLETVEGAPLSLPLTLDGGEAKEIVVRGPVMVPPAVARILSGLPEVRDSNLASLPLSVVQTALGAENLDFLGNKVEPIIVDGQVLGRVMSPPVEPAVVVLVLTTGRGATFSKRMGYPAGPDWSDTIERW